MFYDHHSSLLIFAREISKKKGEKNPKNNDLPKTLIVTILFYFSLNNNRLNLLNEMFPIRTVLLKFHRILVGG